MLKHLLHRDLAYLSCENMDLESASFFARRMLALLPEPAAFYGNRKAPTDFSHWDEGWDSISKSTFDAGVIALAGNVSMIAWIEAED